MTGIRVDGLCRAFAPERDLSAYPEGIVQRVQRVCLGAAYNDNPDVLSPNEEKQLNTFFPHDFLGGSGLFARAMIEGTYIAPAGDGPSSEVGALYRGLVRTNVNEPAYMIGGFRIEKTAAGKGYETIVINDAVVVRVYPNAVQIEGEGTSYGEFPYDRVAAILKTKTGLAGTEKAIASNLTYAVSNLPFMEAYASRQTWENPGRFNSASVDHPDTKWSTMIGKINWEGGDRYLNVDGFGRFFIGEYDFNDPDNNRLYLSGPRSDAQIVAVLKREAVTEKKKDGSQVRRVRSRFMSHETYLSAKASPQSNRGWSCFTWTTFVLTKDGPVAMGELYEKYMAGSTLPALAVYNPETNAVDYSAPTHVSKFFVRPSASDVQLIQYEGASGTVAEPLEVTPNHYLWTRRSGEEYWMPAGYVKAGDEVLTGIGGEKVWDRVVSSEPVADDRELDQWQLLNGSVTSFSFGDTARRAANGALDVYNIGMGSARSPNYLVSSNGKDWLVAHNNIK